MGSNREQFWELGSFAFVGHSSESGFPLLSYTELKSRGGKVFAVDPSVETIDGDPAHDDLASLPEKVEGVVLEVPKAETADWIRRAAEAGIREVWIHMGRDTPEALKVAEEAGINTRHGTCAVMYVKPGFSYHAIHRGIEKLRGTF